VTRRIPGLAFRAWVVLAAIAAIAGLAWLAVSHRAVRPESRAARGAASQPTAMNATAHPAAGRRPNHLAREKSPYLLQHLYNPVDWYPWGEEAFEKARREGKPIFLSIGYSTCHWCHVMERESFEDETIGELMNRDFVAIKVDREERPDVDRLYMTAAQAMGMGGGWPLNLFLTPALEPFFGGTYFPPDSVGGRPGLRQVLEGVHRAWSERRAEIEKSGSAVIAALDTLAAPEPSGGDRPALLAAAYRDLDRAADREQGGFGRAPKFPSAVNLTFLMRVAAREPARRDDALAIVTRQLDAMSAGGIHDQLGGGFHRYSTDREWLVPHFEKMLYDQAQLAWSYLEACQLTGRAEYAATARGIFEYVARDLTAPEGGFDSAEDADSEGEEGRFYVWTPAELESALGREDAALFGFRYGVTAAGNFEHGASILHQAHDLAATARHFSMAPGEASRRLERARPVLLERRAQRVRPHRDDKVIAAWNGLMISAFARGARVLGDPALEQRARRAADFVWARLWDARARTLARRWRDGEAAGQGQLDDYANLALGFTDLYAAGHDPADLERAIALTGAMVERFYDESGGGFWESPAGDASIRVRMKDGYDGAEIGGNSIAALDLLTLGRLLDRRAWLEKAERTFDYYTRRLADSPAAMPAMLAAMDAAREPAHHVVIAGEADAADTRALLAALDRRFRPNDLPLLVNPGTRERLAKLAPFAAALGPQAGRATAYLCENYACRLPTTDPQAFAAQLDQAPAAHARRAR